MTNKLKMYRNGFCINGHDTKLAGRYPSGGCRACMKLRNDEQILTLYNIPRTLYNKMLAAQNGKCYICDSPPKTKRLAVDHDHKSNKVRKLLCGRCNLLVAFVEEKDLLNTAKRYVEEHK